MKRPIKILLTGADGQLGKSILKRLPFYPDFELFPTDIDQLDITDYLLVDNIFKRLKPDYCINAAAYTAVDAAENNIGLAFAINSEAPEYLSTACQANNSVLIHFSTDYVYHSWSKAYLTESAPTHPKGVYARSKLQGEQNIGKKLLNHFIIRTSWLYSEFDNNFVATMLRLASKGVRLRVVQDQVGTPCYATDLADAVFKIMKKNSSKTEGDFGIYNFSNLGVTNWYEFAREIFNYKKIKTDILPISSENYPTEAPRPLNSKLSKKKIISKFDIAIPHWITSLHKCLDLIS